MFTRITVAALALVAAFATAGQAGQRSAADQALYEKAIKDCNGPDYPSGATPVINYAGGWYRCHERTRS